MEEGTKGKIWIGFSIWGFILVWVVFGFVFWKVGGLEAVKAGSGFSVEEVSVKETGVEDKSDDVGHLVKVIQEGKQVPDSSEEEASISEGEYEPGSFQDVITKMEEIGLANPLE